MKKTKVGNANFVQLTRHNFCKEIIKLMRFIILQKSFGKYRKPKKKYKKGQNVAKYTLQ